MEVLNAERQNNTMLPLPKNAALVVFDPPKFYFME